MDSDVILGTRSEHVSVVIGSKLWVIGGHSSTNSDTFYIELDGEEAPYVLYYTFPELNGDIPTTRTSSTANAIGQCVYIFGGHSKYNNKLCYYDEMYQLDTENNEWSIVEISTQIIPPKRSQHCSAILNDKLYIYGGYNEEGGDLDDLWVFDFASKTWSFINSYGYVPIPRGHMSANCINDWGILIIGGRTVHEGPTNSMFIYDTRDGSWNTINVPLDQLPPHYNHSVSVTDSPEPMIYLLGGCVSIKSADGTSKVSHSDAGYKLPWYENYVVSPRQTDGSSRHSFNPGKRTWKKLFDFEVNYLQNEELNLSDAFNTSNNGQSYEYLEMREALSNYVWDLNTYALTIGDLVSENSFYQIYKAHVHDGIRIDCNVVMYNNSEGLFDTIHLTTTDFEELSKIQHPNIITCLGANIRDDKLWIVHEACNGISIYEIMQTRNKMISENQIAFITYQLLLGLKYIHSTNNTHGDIRSENIHITPDGTVKLINSGILSILPRIQNLWGNNMKPWQAPELDNPNTLYTEMTDIYSLGRTIQELCIRADPDCEGMILGYSPILNDFIQLCISKDPTKRPSVDELLQHTLLSSCKRLDGSRVLKNLLIPEETKIEEDDSFRLLVRKELEILLEEHITPLRRKNLSIYERICTCEDVTRKLGSNINSYNESRLAKNSKKKKKDGKK
eukprot:TRINITY_DN2215_c0_g2_i1.p1 TRINITY_DN2215_c0_g2~~TRINITY_DN2215_c0_g2_i1.p1  ORF type:complete len:794 (+),score=144.28 TRINITY_DN2215_c0_g2_i1:357-2384(+)